MSNTFSDEKWFDAYKAGERDARRGSKYSPSSNLIPTNPRELSVDAYYAGWLNTRIDEGPAWRRKVYYVVTKIQDRLVYGRWSVK
jgi:hypothetical protein